MRLLLICAVALGAAQVVCGRQNNKYALERGAGNLACSRLSRRLLRPRANHRSLQEPAESRLQPGLAAPQNGQDFGRTTLAQQPQNPSPMVEHTRTHPRLKEQSPPGRRQKLALGTLFLPVGMKAGRGAAILFFFHGGT
jgi:acetyl esterase/lipase